MGLGRVITAATVTPPLAELAASPPPGEAGSTPRDK